MAGATAKASGQDGPQRSRWWRRTIAVTLLAAGGIGSLASPSVAAAATRVGASASLPTLDLTTPAAIAAAQDSEVTQDQIDALIRRYASVYKVSPDFVNRVVARESNYDPKARNGPYWGLMQIRYETARGVGYRGTPAGLLDPEANLAFGIAYLANALTIAHGDEDRAESLYRTGFYYEAKRRRMLARLIHGKDRNLMEAAGPVVMPESAAPEASVASAEMAAMPMVSLALPLPRPRPLPTGPVVAASPAVAMPVTKLASAAVMPSNLLPRPAAPPPAAVADSGIVAPGMALPRRKPYPQPVATLASVAILPAAFVSTAPAMEQAFDPQGAGTADMQALAPTPRRSPAFAAIRSETGPSSGLPQAEAAPPVIPASAVSMPPPLPRTRPIASQKLPKFPDPALSN